MRNLFYNCGNRSKDYLFRKNFNHQLIDCNCRQIPRRTPLTILNLNRHSTIDNRVILFPTPPHEGLPHLKTLSWGGAFHHFSIICTINMSLLWRESLQIVQLLDRNHPHLRSISCCSHNIPNCFIGKARIGVESDIVGARHGCTDKEFAGQVVD